MGLLSVPAVYSYHLVDQGPGSTECYGSLFMPPGRSGTWVACKKDRENIMNDYVFIKGNLLSPEHTRILLLLSSYFHAATQVANLLCAQADSAFYPQRDGK